MGCLVFGSSTPFLASSSISSLPKIVVWSYFMDIDVVVGIVYCVYNTSYGEFVRVVVLGGRTPYVV